MSLICGFGGTTDSRAALVVSPEEGLVISGFVLGPFDGLEQVYTFQNDGVEPLDFTVSHEKPWISVTPEAGTLAGGAETKVRVRVNSLVFNMPVMTDTDTVNITDTTAGNSVTRLVELTTVLPGPATAEAQIVPQAGRYTITGTAVDGNFIVLQAANTVTSAWENVSGVSASGGMVRYEVLADRPMRYYRTRTFSTGAIQSQLTISESESVDSSVVGVTGDPHGVYIIESSPDGVSDWTVVSTNKLPEDGTLVFINDDAIGQTGVAYRATPAGALELPVLHHALIVGESLAVGFDGAPPLSTSSLGLNHRFSSSDRGQTLLPLQEFGLETIASGAGNQVLALDPSHPMLFSNGGQAGASYINQAKGSAVYTNALRHVADAAQALACELLGYAPGAVFVMAGGGDFANTNYAENIRQWQADYESEIRFLTGTSAVIPMLHSQFSEWSAAFYGGGRASAISPYEVLEEAVANPDKTVLVGPRYFLPHAVEGAQFPGIHLSNEGYRWMGEYYGKVYKETVVDGNIWSPLHPLSAARSGNMITVEFHVPAPPLVLDTTLVSDPGDYGFEYWDGGVRVSLDSVETISDTEVRITLSETPSGGEQRLRYAYTGVPGNPGGPMTGPRGNLRDSDATTSHSGRSLYNWCVHFDMPVE